jgi:hypothetical protein
MQLLSHTHLMLLIDLYKKILRSGPPAAPWLRWSLQAPAPIYSMRKAMGSFACRGKRGMGSSQQRAVQAVPMPLFRSASAGAESACTQQGTGRPSASPQWARSLAASWGTNPCLAAQVCPWALTTGFEPPAVRLAAGGGGRGRAVAAANCVASCDAAWDLPTP